MHRAQIQQALEAAREVSHCREFVIAGSLSVLGFLESPPPAMSMSIDIDFFPLRDPGRASDIARSLGEGSPFHDRFGFYLDAISPNLPTLPEGWQDRLVKLKLGDVTAHFLDVNDTAISKYARGAENDFRWLEAGYDADIFNIRSISARLHRSTEFFDRAEKLAAFSRHRMHMVAMEPTGRIDHRLLSVLHEFGLEAEVKELNTDAGMYCGPVLWVSDDFVVQSLGRGETGIHLCRNWEQRPETGDVITLRYKDGTPELLQHKRERSGPCLG